MPNVFSTRSLGASNRSGIAIYASSTRTNRGSISRVYNAVTPVQQTAIKNNILIKSGSTTSPIPVVILAVSSEDKVVTVSFSCSSALTTSDIKLVIMNPNSIFKTKFTQQISNIIPPTTSISYYQLKSTIGSQYKSISNGSNYSVNIVSNGLQVSCNPFTFTAGTPAITDIQLSPSSNYVLLNGFENPGGSTITGLSYQITNSSNPPNVLNTGSFPGLLSFPYQIPEAGNLNPSSTYLLTISCQNEFGSGCYFPPTTFTTTSN